MTKLGVGALLCFAFILLGSTSATELQYDSNDVNLETLAIADGLKININKFIDSNVKVIQSLLKKIDPLKLLRIPLLGRGSLSNGSLNNLSQIYRSNNCTLQYADDVLSVDLHVGWDNILVHYDYDFKLWSNQRRGMVESGISTLKINLGVGVDLRKFRVVLKALRFSEIGKFFVKTKESTRDNIPASFVKLITNLLKKRIVDSLEQETVNSMSEVVDEVNRNMPNNRQFTFLYPASARQLNIDAFQHVETEYYS